MRKTTLRWFMTVIAVIGFAFYGNAQIQIGDETNEMNIPINPYFGYSYSQSIYTSAEINASGDITELSFQFNGNSTISSSIDWVIYVGHTTKTEFTSTTDWIPVGSMTEVFNGQISVVGSGSDEWITIDITDFTYNGSDNLVIAVNETTSGFNGGSDDFYSTAVSNNRSIYERNDDSANDPSAPPTADGIQSYIANIILGGITESCPIPTAQAASDLLTTSVTLSWTSGATETNWNVEYGATGYTQGTGTMVTPAPADTFTNVIGLTASTLYDFYVQADCGGDQSAWVGPFSFATLCGINMAPYTENFDATTLTPQCWEEDASDDFDWSYGSSTVSSDTGPQSGDNTSGSGNFAYIEATGPSANDSAIIYTPFIDASALTIPVLEFYYNMYGVDMGTLTVEINQAGTWTEIFTISGDQGQDWQEVLIDLGTYVNPIQFRFIGIRGADYTSDISIDDVSVKEGPSCWDPSSLSFQNLEATSVELTWTTGGATEWDILFGVSPFDTTGVASSATTDNPLTVDTLTPETTYEYYVRDICAVGDSSEWVGPFQFTTTASCPAPTDLTAINITSSAADIGWNGYNATHWDVLFGVAGFDTTGMAITANDITDNPLTIDTLQPATSYEFYVRADCGQDNIDTSIWVGPFEFTTLCEAYSIPWVEGFESIATAGDFPSCVDYTNDFSTETSPQSYNRDARTGTNYLFTNWSADDWFFTVGVNLTAGESYDFTYWYNTDGGAVWQEMSSWVGTSQDALGMTDSLVGVVDAINTTYQELRGTYVAPTTGVYYFGVHVISNISTWYASFDDFKIDLTPNCPVPTDLNVSGLTASTADLGWTTGGSTEWDILFGVAGFDTTGLTPNVENTMDNPFTVDTLTTLTSYEFYVRDDCGANDSSEWVGPFTFTTSCEVYTTFPYLEDFEGATFIPVCWTKELGAAANDITHSSTENHTTAGTYSARFSSYSSASDYNQYLITPSFTIDASYPELSFWYTMSDDDTDTLSYGIVTSIDTTWVGVDKSYGAWSQETHDLSSYAGQDIYFIFHYWGDYAYYVYFDDFKIDEEAVTDLALVTPGNEDVYECNFTGQDTVPFFVQNVGDAIIPANDTIFAWYELDGGTAVADTFIIATDLNPTDTMFAFFAQEADLAGFITHNYKVYFEYEPGSDMNQINDTTIGTVTHYALTVDLGGVNDTIQTTSYPYTLDAGANYDSYLWNDASTNQTLDVNADGWYNVLVTDSNYCEASDSVYVLLSVGINTIDDINLNIYPNPNNGEFTLNARFNSAIDFTVEIINLNGKTIYTKEFNGVDAVNETIDIDEYSKGVYYIRIVNNDFVKQEKIVIQ